RRRVAARLERFVRDRLPTDLQETFGLYVGCTVLVQNASVRFERLVYSALEQAFTDSLQQRKKEQRDASLKLKMVLKTESVHPVYQPVVDLLEKRVVGFEALTLSRPMPSPGRISCSRRPTRTTRCGSSSDSAASGRSVRRAAS